MFDSLSLFVYAQYMLVTASRLSPWTARLLKQMRQENATDRALAELTSRLRKPTAKDRMKRLVKRLRKH